MVHIYNPQNYEILSFTLNGYKYQSYEFKEGSNSTRLIIEVNAGFVSGLKEFTIDAIKYINGTEIKDVQMDGEKTVKAGVRYEIVPTASIIKEEIGTTSYQSIVEIKDDAKLMDQLTGMHFFIYDGYSIIKHQALSLGLNNIKIEDLAMGSNYQFMVVGVYDDYSGNGKRAVGLIDNEITTLDGYLVDSAISTQSQIKVKLKQLDPSASFKAIDLFKENILLETKEYSSEITFDNLLSNNEYMIKVTYSYLKDGVERISTINFKIKTESKQVPSISLTNFSSSKKEISYQLLESDIDNVKQSFTASLYKDGYLVDETNELVSIFNGLYSNMEYKVVFTYQYDLNDGLGVQTITKEEVIKTKALDTPTLDVKYQVTSTKISYHGILTDIDNTFSSVTYKLYRGDNLIESSSEMTDEFDGLIPNTLYRLVVSYYYDLNDSNPLYNATLNYEIETLKQIPTINLNVSNITDNSVKVVTSLNDPNVVGTINSIKLYLNDVLISEKVNNDSDFKELLSNTTYKVVVEASYDLNDGVGSINIEKELSFTTYKKTPSVKIEATSTKKSISYQISYSDVDNIFNLGKVEIIKDNQVVSELSSLTGTVESLNPSTNYIVRVTYSYDVNDGLGVQTITKEEVIRTSNLTAPTVGINFVSISDSQITAKIVSSDVDNIFNIDEIQLFKGSSLINTYDVSDLNENNELIITTISNTEYTFVVKYSYSLDGGTNIQNSVYQSTVISSKEVPIISLTPYFTSQNSLSYNLLISDPNASGHVQMISLYSGSTFIKRLSESTTTIDSLDSNTQYSIKVNYVYDFDDGLGSREINYSYNFTTLKQEPVISLSSANVTKNSIEFSYDLVDVDNALRLEKLELFNNNILIQTYTEWNQNVFNDLLSNNEYKIIGTFIKNINSGDEIVTRSLFVTTNSLEIPSVDIHLTSTRDEVSYEYVLNDPDKVSELSSIDIYYQGNKLDNQSIDNVFSNLYTDSLYEVVITLLCDYRDGKLPKEERYTKMIKTESYNVPNVNLDLTSTEETINYQIVYSDPFNLINPTKINIYKDDEIVQEISNLEINTIDNLLSNTLYTIELVYEYNLNDNRGTITEYYRRSYSTLAYNVKVKNYTVLNELTPKTNEDINILINIENKSNVKVEYVIVNGVKKQISGGDFYNSIIIIERSPKISGNYQIVVSKMGYILNGIEVEQEVESDIEISIEIMSRLDIISCSIVNDSSVYKKNYGFGVVLTIDNPNNYLISEYRIFSNNHGWNKYIPVDMIDNNHIYINLNLFSPNVYVLDFVIKGVKYYDDSGNLTERKFEEPLDLDAKLIDADSNTHSLVVHQINTIDDFINMFNDPYGIYELSADLDFTGYTWVSRDFYGYFDGRGHKLSNISIIEENEYNSTQYVGIFKDCSNSVIKNVYFENLYMNVDTSNSVNSYIINASGTPNLSNILISGNINFKPTSSSVLYYPTGTNIYYVDHLNFNSQKYTGNNLISLEQYNSKEFIENVLKWDFKEKEKENYNGLLYTIYQNSYIIIDGYNGTNADLVIPESINGLPVIGIADLAFENNTTIKSIEYSESLLFIGASTLKGCYNIETVIIHEALAFFGYNLVNILFGAVEFENSYKNTYNSLVTYIPNSFKNIFIESNTPLGDNYDSILNVYFTGVKSLEYVEINYPGNISYSMFYDCSSLKTVVLNGITSIGDSAFYNCSSLTSITIPEGVTSIGSYAFVNCSSLTSITIPDSVTSIGDSAFNVCGRLTSITIPEGVTSMGCGAFSGCSSLTSITIPESVTSIGDNSFRYCSSLTSITIPKGVKSIGKFAFEGCTRLTSVTIPEGVTSIGDYVFINCSSLTSITIPEGVTSIGDYAFNGCSSLTSITIPSSVTSIGDYAFYCCISLTSIIIPEGVTSIGCGAFNCCSSLTSIIIPSSVTSIGDSAFLNCYSLTIYCETQSKPSGWDSDWNPENRPVIWGYKKD